MSVKGQGPRLHSYFYRKIQSSSEGLNYATGSYILMSVSKIKEKPNKSNAVLLAINHLLVLWWGSRNWIGDLSYPDGHRTLEERCCLILSPIIYEILSSLYGILNWGHHGKVCSLWL